MTAAELFEQGRTDVQVARELQVTRMSVNRWRRAYDRRGIAGLRSKGPASRPRLSPAQFARLEAALERGPLAHGFADQRWTLARIRTLIGRMFPNHDLPSRLFPRAVASSSLKGRGRSSVGLVRVLSDGCGVRACLGWGRGGTRSWVVCCGPAGRVLWGVLFTKCDAELAALRLPFIPSPRPWWCCGAAWCGSAHGRRDQSEKRPCRGAEARTRGDRASVVGPGAVHGLSVRVRQRTSPSRSP